MIGVTRTACDEGVILGSPRTAGAPENTKRWILAATIFGSSMAFIDGSVVSIALPAMQADLNTSVRGAQWIVNAYMLMLGALILVGGAAGDRYGRKKMFLLGVVVFTIASISCALAPNVAALIGARALQGLGGALMVPGSLAIVSAAFPQGERGRAIGTWAGFSAITTALGPVLGGWLVDASSWRTIFFVNVPLGVVTVALVLWRVPESRDEANQAAVDWRGGLLATAGLGALAYGLTNVSAVSERRSAVLVSLAASVVLLIGFLWWQKRAPSPMMPLELFRSRRFSGANAVTFLLYFALGGALFFVPFNLIGIQGFSATRAGAAFLPFTLIVGILSRWSGALTDRYGTRAPLTVGPLIVAGGFTLFALPGVAQSYWTSYFPAMVVLGLGMAITVAPLTTAVMESAGDRHSGVASAINNAMARLAGMVAVAVLGAIAVDVFRGTLEERLTGARVPTELREGVLAQASKLAEAKVPPVADEDQQVMLSNILHESFLHSFRTVMLLMAAMALAGAVCGWWTMPATTRQRAEAPHVRR